MTLDPLRTALQELARELLPSGIRLIVAGGYGLVLRVQHAHDSGVRTRGPSIPSVRGTEDIDCFLAEELITDGKSMAAIREALDRLEYEPVMEHVHFERKLEDNGVQVVTKVDFLAAPVPENKKERMHIKRMRMRPRSFTRLHAYLTPEAFSIEEDLLRIDVSDDASGLYIYLPHPFSYLVLKLAALRDRIAQPESRGKYHALDLYTVWATITEEEWHQAERLRERFADHAVMAEARVAAEALFGASESPGVIALRDQARRQYTTISDDVIEEFRSDLRTLLGSDI